MEFLSIHGLQFYISLYKFSTIAGACRLSLFAFADSSFIGCIFIYIYIFIIIITIFFLNWLLLVLFCFAWKPSLLYLLLLLLLDLLLSLLLHLVLDLSLVFKWQLVLFANRTVEEMKKKKTLDSYLIIKYYWRGVFQQYLLTVDNKIHNHLIE